MKLILLSIFVLFYFDVNAQIEFSPETSTEEFFLDLTDEFVNDLIRTELKNNTDSTLFLKWEVVKVDVPEEWQIVLVANIGGLAWELYSNIDAVTMTNIPLEILPFDSSEMNLHVRPNGIPGCGNYEIRISSVDDPNTILATGYYNYIINTSPDCFTSIADLEKEQIQIFPNPTQDYFSLTENTLVKEIEIFNIVGKEMMKMDYQNGKSINISTFPNGLYLLRMLDENGKFVKNIRLVKR